MLGTPKDNMPQVISKMAPIGVSCHTYVHPWTTSCPEASVGLFLYALYYSLRIYSTVYTLALLMKGRIPTLEELKKTLKGILQSTAFLGFEAFGYSMFLCTFRRMFGNYNILTISFLPSFCSNVLSILIERPSRRGLLALYVSNVATETLWNMARSRDLVQPIRYAPVMIFSGSMALLLAYYKAGLHKSGSNAEHADGMFNILKFVVGPQEEYGYAQTRETPAVSGTADNAEPSTSASSKQKRSTNANPLQMVVLSAYKRIVQSMKCCDKHTSCPHPHSCFYYTLQGTAKMFSIGLALQAGVRTLFNIRTLFRSPKSFMNAILRKDLFSIASFLAGSCGVFRSIMCLMRHITGQDSPYYALPAGLIAGLSFTNYPDTTVALYVFWKMLQITYTMGIDRGVVPEVPGFTIFLYSFSTAVLFHAALVEPNNLRVSYWKFLHSISGGRVAIMGREAMDAWGLETSKNLATLMKKTKTAPNLKYFFFK